MLFLPAHTQAPVHSLSPVLYSSSHFNILNKNPGGKGHENSRSSFRGTADRRVFLPPVLSGEEEDDSGSLPNLSPPTSSSSDEDEDEDLGEENVPNLCPYRTSPSPDFTEPSFSLPTILHSTYLHRASEPRFMRQAPCQQISIRPSYSTSLGPRKRALSTSTATLPSLLTNPLQRATSTIYLTTAPRAEKKTKSQQPSHLPGNTYPTPEESKIASRVATSPPRPCYQPPPTPRSHPRPLLPCRTSPPRVAPNPRQLLMLAVEFDMMNRGKIVSPLRQRQFVLVYARRGEAQGVPSRLRFEVG